MRWILAVIAALLLPAGAAADTYDWSALYHSSPSVRVIEPALDCLATPEDGSPVVMQMGLGANLQTLTWDKGGWVEISTILGPCWVPQRFVGPAYMAAPSSNCPCGSGTYCTGARGGSYCDTGQSGRRYGR